MTTTNTCETCGLVPEDPFTECAGNYGAEHTTATEAARQAGVTIAGRFVPHAGGAMWSPERGWEDR